MKMDSTGSDHSPPLSEIHQADSWISGWENDDSSVSGLNLGLHDLVEDREVAARAVAFVVNSTRKGIVPLCADVATILRSKKVLEKKVIRLKCENESLRSSRAGSVQTSHSASPPASVNSYSDRASSQPHERPSRPCSRCSSHCSSYTSSNSPKLDKKRGPGHHQRSSPPHNFYPNSTYRRSSSDNTNGNNQQVVVTAIVHSAGGAEEIGGGGRGGQVSSPASFPGTGGSPNNNHHGHQRKGSLPQMVSEPHAGVPKVSPHSQRVSVEVQCSLVGGGDDTRMEERFQETLRVNSKLTQDLEAANKVIESLKSSLKELEMKQLAHECLEEYELECQAERSPVSPHVSTTKDTPLVLPVLQRADSIRSSRSSLQSSLKRRTSHPTLIPSPLDGCRCSNCKDQTTTRSTLVIPPKNGLSNDVRGRLQLEEGDHVVVRGERTGHVCYIGHLDDFTPADAIFVGLELDAPVGRHDGAVNGHRYYQCAKNHGAFVPLQDILCIIAKKSCKGQQPPQRTERVEKSHLTIEMDGRKIIKDPSEPDCKSEKMLMVNNKRERSHFKYTDPHRINMDGAELV